jgi:hypothetical protein
MSMGTDFALVPDEVTPPAFEISILEASIMV